MTKQQSAVIPIAGMSLVGMLDGLFIASEWITPDRIWQLIISVESMLLTLSLTVLMKNNLAKRIVYFSLLHIILLIAGYGLHMSNTLRLFESVPVYFVASVAWIIILAVYVSKPWKLIKTTPSYKDIHHLEETAAELRNKETQRAYSGISNVRFFSLGLDKIYFKDK